MVKKILIDAGQPEEIRVALIDEKKQIEDLDFELHDGPHQIKGNIYLAKVLRVEASLQAVFVDYGNEKQGFLSFHEIHHSYFNIPKEEKKKVFEVIYDTTANFSEHTTEDEEEQKNINWHKKYTVQQVIKPKQTLLVQVIKEERGNKCAALTTYISLAGRYCILMPNTPGKMGISRKIQSTSERTKLKDIVSDLEIDDEMSVVIRTVGEGKSKREISRDYECLLKIWEDIKADAEKSVSPALIYEESCLIKRTIRDLYTDDVGSVIVEGDEAYKIAKNVMKAMIPSHIKNVKQYKPQGVSLFKHYNIERQLDTIYSPRVDLKSGGYIVINHTEALIAIDINSGKATKERNIEETAFKTNIEAAEEICRQMIIRNLSGIIIIDFIDMDNLKNREKLEQAMASFLKKDRARTQISKISKLGLMEVSRQMLKPSIVQSKSNLCPHCGGLGYVQTSDTVGMRVIRALQSEISGDNLQSIEVRTTSSVAMNVLNNHRAMLAKIEEESEVKILVTIDNEMTDCKFEFYKTMKPEDDTDSYDSRHVTDESLDEIDLIKGTEQKDDNKKPQKEADQSGRQGGNIKTDKNRGRALQNKKQNTPLGSGNPSTNVLSKNNNETEHSQKPHNNDRNIVLEVISDTSDFSEGGTFVPINKESEIENAKTEDSIKKTTKRRRRSKAKQDLLPEAPVAVIAKESEEVSKSTDNPSVSQDSVGIVKKRGSRFKGTPKKNASDKADKVSSVISIKGNEGNDSIKSVPASPGENTQSKPVAKKKRNTKKEDTEVSLTATVSDTPDNPKKTRRGWLKI